MSTTPSEIGPYRVLRELGRGGMGVVYEVEPLACPGARYALKLLIARDARARERFRREGDLLSRLDGNRNVVRVHVAGEDKGRPYLVLDLVEGESLESVIGRGPVPWPRALELMEQVANGLAAVHERGILHRDLKPSNVLVDRDGLARLTDFGIANADDLEPLTRTGALVGTVDYLAPELLRGEKNGDPRGDLWAFGACLYELLTGERPFPAATVIERARLTDSETARPPSERVPEIPGAVDRFVLRLLARDKDARPASARECASELATLRRTARGRTPIAGVALALLAVVAACVVLATARTPARRADPPPPPLVRLEDELRRASAEAASRPDDALRHVESVLEAARGMNEKDAPGLRGLVESAERLRQALSRSATAQTTSATFAFSAAITRARAARGADNPSAFTPIDDPSIVVRHAEQVSEFLDEAHRADPSRELPRDLIEFIVGAGCAYARHNGDAINKAVKILELAVKHDPGLPLARNEAAYYELIVPEGASRALENARSVLDGKRATPEERERAFELAIRAEAQLGHHAEARRLGEKGIGEFPENRALLRWFAEERLMLRDPSTVETTERLVKLARGTDDRIFALTLHARACVECAKDGKAALAALAELRAAAAKDSLDDLKLTVRAHLLVPDVKQARRVLALAHAAAEKEGVDAAELAPLDDAVAAADR